ncbi:MAG: hypothetical protein ABIH78_04270 [Candidatus Peregrinibacteria bacterium]
MSSFPEDGRSDITEGSGNLGAPPARGWELLRLVENITESVRAASPEASAEIPKNYKAQYDALPADIQSLCPWEELSARLLAQEGHYLQLTKSMPNGGELAYIDEEGNPVFRNGGLEPVMMGESYDEVMKALNLAGYEMPTRKDVRAIESMSPETAEDEIRREVIERITGRTIGKIPGKPFVASDDEKTFRASFVKTDEKPDFPWRVVYVPSNGNETSIERGFAAGNFWTGVVPLLIVRKM